MAKLKNKAPCIWCGKVYSIQSMSGSNDRYVCNDQTQCNSIFMSSPSVQSMLLRLESNDDEYDDDDEA